MFLVMFLVFILTTSAQVMAAQPTVNLGTTASFAVLAGSTMTNTESNTEMGGLILLIACGLLAYVLLRIRSRKMKLSKKNISKTNISNKKG